MKEKFSTKLKEFGQLFVYYLWYSVKCFLWMYVIFIFIPSFVMPFINDNIEWAAMNFVAPFIAVFVGPLLTVFMVIVRMTGLWKDPLRHKRELLFFGVMAYVVVTAVICFQINITAMTSYLKYIGALCAWFGVFRAYQIYRDRRNPNRDLEDDDSIYDD